MKKTLFALFAMLVASSAFAQFGGYGNYYGGFNSGEERQISSQQYGTNNALRQGEGVEVEILSVRNVRIQRNASWARQAAFGGVGAGLGALAGNQVGSGKGKTVATWLGGIAGGAAGAAMAQPDAVPAQELAVRKVGGTKIVMVVQAESDFRVGERAIAVQVGGELRVGRMYADEPVAARQPRNQEPLAAVY